MAVFHGDDSHGIPIRKPKTYQQNKQKSSEVNFRVSHEKNPLTFHSTGCLIGVLIMTEYNPQITG